MNNSADKLHDSYETFKMPATLEDFQREVEAQGGTSENSSTSGMRGTEQPAATKTLEIRFVPNLRKTSQAEKSVKFIQIVGYPKPPQAPSSKKPPSLTEQERKRFANVVVFLFWFIVVFLMFYGLSH